MAMLTARCSAARAGPPGVSHSCDFRGCQHHQQYPHIPFIDKHTPNCTRAEGRPIRLKEEDDIGPFIGLTSIAASASGADSFLGTLWSKDTHAFTQK